MKNDSSSAANTIFAKIDASAMNTKPGEGDREQRSDQAAGIHGAQLSPARAFSVH